MVDFQALFPGGGTGITVGLLYKGTCTCWATAIAAGTTLWLWTPLSFGRLGKGWKLCSGCAEYTGPFGRSLRAGSSSSGDAMGAGSGRAWVRLACSRRSDSGARAKNKVSEREKKTRGDWGRGRGNACVIFSKEAVPPTFRPPTVAR